jgi:hypothetical protein
MLADSGYEDVLGSLRQLARAGKVEFTGSGIYHPILPLIPADEVDRQIRRNHQVNREILGDVFQPRGFFPPEMAYSADIVGAVAEQRHDWVIISGVACPTVWPTDVIYQVKREGETLAVLFRDDVLSNRISFKETTAAGFIQHLHNFSVNGRDAYVVTAMDAETFGHHIKNWETLFLAEVYRGLDTNPGLHRPSGNVDGRGIQARNIGVVGTEARAVLISDLLTVFPHGVQIEPLSSSWSTSEDDIRQRNYYPLWKSKGNEIHSLLWDHLEIAVEVTRIATGGVRNADGTKYAALARSLLDKALHSDQFWWASKKPMWDINMIHRGLDMQSAVILNAFKALTVSPEAGVDTRDAYHKVLAARCISERVVDLLWAD